MSENDEDRIASTPTAPQHPAPSKPSPARPAQTRPAGIAAAGRTWVICALAGLLLHFIQLILALEAAEKGRDDKAGAAILVALVSFCYYGLILRVGAGFRKGRSVIQFPAWLVVLSAPFLLLVTTAGGLNALIDLGLWQRTGILRPGWGSGQLLAVWLGSYFLLLGVQVALVAAACVLLWQSARYVHWVRSGRAAPAPAELIPFPGAIAFAGWIWTVVGCVFAIFVWLFALNVLGNSGEFAEWSPLLKFVLLGELTLIALVPALFGVLLLNGRLRSTRAPGIVSLVLVLLELIQALAGVLSFSGLATRPPGSPAAHLLYVVGFLVQAVLAFLAGLGSIACIAGNTDYRAWLRTAQGLDV
jgi:hypothetical protein